jgi:N-acetylated-alpha-linked acidic dipeptidase
VPFKFVPYALALREHVDELRSIHAKRVRWADSATTNGELEFAGLPALVDAVRTFRNQAEELDRATAAVADRDGVKSAILVSLNDSLAKVERAFLLEQGLPERPWFKHAIYAPGLTTGYAAWPLPAIRQALEDKKKEALATHVPLTVERIKKATAAMESACKEAKSVLARH